MVIFGVFNSATDILIFGIVPVIVIAGLICRIYKAKKSRKKPVKDEAKRYAGRALMTFDPITGAPYKVVDKTAVVEYIEAHFEDGQNDETGIYGKDRSDY
ncbi:MAG: hypothetical protein LBS67_07635 [Clostridiales Family XIII bacterium]|jgi:hypothetical protein|nr:hypothetical protein [Clostridiales Family XIII bacterium]